MPHAAHSDEASRSLSLRRYTAFLLRLMQSLSLPALFEAGHGFTSGTSTLQSSHRLLPRQRIASVAGTEANSTSNVQLTPVLRSPSPNRRTSAMSLDEIDSGSSEEEQSRTHSFQSTSTAPYGSLKKSHAKPKTSFQLAHPPPIIKPKQRLKLRPRVLLQLHQLSETARPTPAFDVLPSTIFAPRLRNRFPRLFKGKDGLGPNDLVVVSSATYARYPSPEDGRGNVSDEEGWDHREVVATICQLRKEDGGGRGKAEICFENGPSWEATPLMNGGYEFVATDEHGLVMKARWVVRNRLHRRTTSMAAGSSGRVDEDRRFTFSIIDPTTRRHPIIASLNRGNIEVLNEYPSVIQLPASTSDTPLSPLSAASSSTNYFDSTNNSTMPMVKTDERLRTLVVTTGIWVVFREGWSKSFSYVDVTSPPPSPVTQNFQCDKDGGTPKKPRHSGSNFLQRSGNPVDQPATPTGHGPAPKRSNSTGAAFMERASTRRSLSAARRVSKLTSTPSSDGSSDEGPYNQKKLSRGSERFKLRAPTQPTLQAVQSNPHKTVALPEVQANERASKQQSQGLSTDNGTAKKSSSFEPNNRQASNTNGLQKGTRSRRFSRLWSCLMPRRATTR